MSMTAYCVREGKPCIGAWVEKYFKDCLCGLKDEISFGFGLVSLVCWGVAEIPQIITNFRTKSSHGVSLAFLMTWVAGDVFNLVGCVLEPATLPTQYFTALLYTISTVVLVLQSVYYDHLYRLWKRRHSRTHQKVPEEKEALRQKSFTDSGIPIPSASPKAPLRREFYYTSARSLASSGTPPFRTYMGLVRSGPSALEINSGSSSDDEAAPVSMNKKPVTQPRPIPRSVGYGTFLAASATLPLRTKSLSDTYFRITTGRRLHEGAMEHSVFGQWLGWLMAVIYMGGRIPQICLNFRRGNVEGLNPLMFIFALIANVAYVGSILVRTLEWENIKANMPWLLDAIVCVALDLFIILQYVYYRYLRKTTVYLDEEVDGHYNYKEDTKVIVS